MRRHKILTRTILMLSIINFALAAPVAARERAEVRLDANVTRNVTAGSQKRWDTLDWGGAPNVPGLDHAPPPSPDFADILRQMEEQLAEQHRYTDSPPPPLDSPGSLTGSYYVPPSLGSPTGSRLPVEWMAVAGSLSPPPPPSPHLSPPGPSEGRFPPGFGFSVNPETLSSTGHQNGWQWMEVAGSLSPLPPSPHPSPPGPSEGRFPPGFGFSVNPETLSSTGHQPTPPQSPTGGSPLPPLPHPRPLADRFPSPPGFPASPDTLSSTGSSRPTPPPSPGVDPEIHSLLNLELFPNTFWDKFLKGKIKRRTSGPGLEGPKVTNILP